MWQNARDAIGNVTLEEHRSHNSNMKCHNLCTTKQPPLKHAKLLGLGAKLFIQTGRIHKDNLIATLKRFKYDDRVKHYVQTHIGYSDKTAPKLHIKMLIMIKCR